VDPGNETFQTALKEAQNMLLTSGDGGYSSSAANAGILSSVMALSALPQSEEVVWNMEILKDRIWLSDPPKSPFRPRSLFMFTAAIPQHMLGMTPHATREAIAVDQLLEFFVKTCHAHSQRPAMVKVSDTKLHALLAPHLASVHVRCHYEALSDNHLRFLNDTLASFDAREREQWKDNPKFSGVLRQRSQPGLMSIPGNTLLFARHLLFAAARFYRSKAYIYFAGPVGISIPGISTRVARITLNNPSCYGLAMTTLDAANNPNDCGSQSYQFQEVSNIPFEDADLIERYGLDVADGAYPLPVLHTNEGSVARPSLEDLHWYEAVFHALTSFVQQTYAMPTFIHKGDICYAIKVSTHLGWKQVTLTVPPSTNTTPQVYFDDIESQLPELDPPSSVESPRGPEGAPPQAPRYTPVPGAIPMIPNIGLLSCSLPRSSATPSPRTQGLACGGRWALEQASLSEFRSA
jgi:hypothetical protein